MRGSGQTSVGEMSCVSACPPATARAGPKQSAATGTADEPRGTGPTTLCPPAVCVSVTPPTGAVRAPLLRFGSPSAHPGCGASWSRWMPTTGRSRFGVFAVGPRAGRSTDFDGVRPCGFALEAARVGVGRCGGRSRRLLRLPVVRPEGGSTDCEDFDHRHVFDKPLRARPWWSRARGYPIHISRRQIAPSCPGRVIRRGRFSHATFRTRHSRAPQPGRATRVLPSLPSGGAHGVVTLRRFAPDRRVDARVPHTIFR
jgi:hypothetical protein